ncbi:MAG: hypothetical protein V9G19_12565 [Tetrasphaera sp.]
MGSARVQLVRFAIAMIAAVATIGWSCGPAGSVPPRDAAADDDAYVMDVAVVLAYWAEDPPTVDPRAGMTAAVAAADSYYSTVMSGRMRVHLAAMSTSWQRIELSETAVASCTGSDLMWAVQEVAPWVDTYAHTLVMTPPNPACGFDIAPVVNWGSDSQAGWINQAEPLAAEELISLLASQFYAVPVSELVCTLHGTRVPLSNDCRAGARRDPWSPVRLRGWNSQPWVDTLPARPQPIGYPHPREVWGQLGPFIDVGVEGKDWRRIPTDQGPQVVEIDRVAPLGQGLQAGSGRPRR